MYPCALTFIKFIAIRRYLVFDFEKGFIVKKEANSPSFVHTSIWNLLYCETQPPASIFVSNCIFVWFNKNFDIIYVQNIVVLGGLLLAPDGMKEAFQYGGYEGEAPLHCSLAGAPSSLVWDSGFTDRRRWLMDSRRACSILSSLAWNTSISSLILDKAFSTSVSQTVVWVAVDVVAAIFFCFFTNLAASREMSRMATAERVRASSRRCESISDGTASSSAPLSSVGIWVGWGLHIRPHRLAVRPEVRQSVCPLKLDDVAVHTGKW